MAVATASLRDSEKHGVDDETLGEVLAIAFIQ